MSARRARRARRALLDEPGARIAFAFSQGVAVVLSSVVSGIGYEETFNHQLGHISAFLAVGTVAGLLFAGGMYAVDGARRLREPIGVSAIRDATVIWLGVILLITFLAFSLKAGAQLSRGAIITFLLLGYSAILATRATTPRAIGAVYRSTGFATAQAMVIAASGNSAGAAVVAELQALGLIDPVVIELSANCSEEEWPAELSAAVDRIYSAARTMPNGDICIAAGGISDRRLRDIMTALQVIPRSVQVIPEPVFERLLHLPLRHVGRLHSVELQKSPMNGVQRFVKRALDLAISIPLLIFVIPLLGAIAIAIKLDSKGPVLFLQKRLGHRGKPFTVMKFRSMSVLEDGNEVRQAQKADPRVTRVGRWLRASSLDELPQLVNVIMGQMSLVGPRPHAVAHDQMFSKLVANYEIRQHVKPGITGWAQVNGLRGETASVDLMRQRVEMDMWYAKNASIWIDLKILALTIVEVFRQRNAY